MRGWSVYCMWGVLAGLMLTAGGHPSEAAAIFSVPDAADALITQFRDESASLDVRIAAARKMVDHPSMAAISALIEGLSINSKAYPPDLQGEIMTTMRAIGTPVWDEFNRRLDQGDQNALQLAFAFALSPRQYPFVQQLLPHVEMLVYHKDPCLRGLATSTLVSMKAEAKPYLNALDFVVNERLAGKYSAGGPATVDAATLIVATTENTDIQHIRAKLYLKKVEASREFLGVVARGDPEKVARALALGANPNAWDDTIRDSWESAIKIAVSYRYPEILKLLIDAGADVNLRHGIGDTYYTALDFAGYYHDEKSLEMTRILTEAGGEEGMGAVLLKPIQTKAQFFPQFGYYRLSNGSP